MTAVVSIGGQQTTELQHLASYWHTGTDDTPFLQGQHISAVFHTLTVLVQSTADSFATCPSWLG